MYYDLENTYTIQIHFYSKFEDLNLLCSDLRILDIQQNDIYISYVYWLSIKKLDDQTVINISQLTKDMKEIQEITETIMFNDKLAEIIIR